MGVEQDPELLGAGGFNRREMSHGGTRADQGSGGSTSDGESSDSSNTRDVRAQRAKAVQ